MRLDPSVAVVIKVPPEAIVPIIVGGLSLGLLAFGNTAMQAWKKKSPGAATKFGLVIAVLLTGYAVYRGITVIPAEYIDRGRYGETTIGFFDGPILAFCVLIGALFWSFANQRYIAWLVGVGLGLLIFAKPFIWPLHAYDEGSVHQWGFTDPEHLSFHGPGLLAMIVGLIAGLKPR